MADNTLTAPAASWLGSWIWAGELLPTDLRYDLIPPENNWNRFVYLRRAFELEAVPDRVPSRVTADSRYVLFVNGGEVARGPARSVPERLAYDELNLAPYLVTGRNVVAAWVRFYGQPSPWWQPARPTLQLGHGSFAFEAPAIGLVSDDTWRARVAPYLQPSVPSQHNIPTEILDGREVSVGWAAPGFDDGDWTPAAVVMGVPLDRAGNRPGATPFTRPEPSGIALRTALPVDLANVRSGFVPTSEQADPLAALEAATDAGDPFTTYDAGGITLATPRLRVRGPAGSCVDVFVGEDLTADGRAEIAPRGYAFRYLLRGAGSAHSDGDEDVEGFEAVGFRYLTTVVRGGAEVLAVTALERRYPREPGAAFECGDATLERIWTVGARTLELCSTDAFVDCPGREQRAWVGDSYLHALLTMVTNPDTRLVRRHLRLAAQCRRADGLLSMTAVGDLSMVSLTIPDWSLHWVRELARYYDYTGDADTAVELLPTAAEILGYFEPFRGADGLLWDVPGWVFIDWAQTERANVVGALDALVAAASRDLARLLELLDVDPRTVGRCRAAADATREGFDKLWDADRGLYVDALFAGGRRGRRVSQQTNAMAIVGDCAPAERWPAMLDAILDRKRQVVTRTPGDQRDDPGALLRQWSDPVIDVPGFDPETSVVAAQPFYRHFLHQAVVKAGRRTEIPELVRDWSEQLDAGATTFGEYWTAADGASSRCHAWSATPTYDLTTHVLGVVPTSPGFATVDVSPCFGPLDRLAGRVPTPLGWLSIDLDRDRGGWIDVPSGVEAHVDIVDAALAGGTFGAGRHEIRPRSD